MKKDYEVTTEKFHIELFKLVNLENAVPEIDRIYTYLKMAINKIDGDLNADGPNEVYEEAKAIADRFKINDLISLKSLNEPYRKNKYPSRAIEAAVRNLVLFVKMAKLLENGQILEVIDLFLHFNFQQGQIQQSMAEEEGFKKNESKRSKAGTDKRYSKHKLIRDEACKLLRQYKPDDGWKNRSVAERRILPDLENFVNNLDLSDGNIHFDPENISNVLAEWMKTSGNDVSIAFTETASQTWLDSRVKNKPS